MVRKGNEYAFEVSILMRECFATFILVDFLRSAGEFFDQKPVEFFRIVSDNQVYYEWT